LSKKQNNILKGSFAACLVIFIWSTWLVISRVGAQSALTIFDLAALRYGVSALVTLPVVIYFKPWRTFSLIRMLTIAGFLGPLYIFCVFGGFIFAPVAHGGVFLNGSLPVLTLFIGVVFFSQSVSITQGLGLILIILASLLSIKDVSESVTATTWKGDILFFASAIFFSGYLILAREWSLSMMEVVFCGSTINCLIYLPIWFFFLPKGTFDFSSVDFLTQAFYQGIMPNVIGLLLVAHAAKNIGSAATAAFLAGVPPLSTILGLFFLDESLGLLGWVSVFVIVPGIILVAVNKKVI
tara:strand:- start:5029 stop:5916 length:888 start_codon:yes stop_codon:yes gene_type:complete